MVLTVESVRDVWMRIIGVLFRRSDMKYVICPRCGNHLDFGEKCDCEEEQRIRVSNMRKRQAEAIRLVEQGDAWEQLELAI